MIQLLKPWWNLSQRPKGLHLLRDLALAGLRRHCCRSRYCGCRLMEIIIDIKGVVDINVNLTGWAAWTSLHIGDYVALLCPCSSTYSATSNTFPHHHIYIHFSFFFSQMGPRFCDHGNCGLVLLRLCGGAMHKECWVWCSQGLIPLYVLWRWT